VISSHVLEHLRDPIGALEAMASTLTVDGVIWAEVPNVRKPYGDLATHYWQRAHLYSFSPETAALAALRAGLTGIASRADQDHGRVLFLTARNPQTRTPRTYAESVQLLGGEPQTGVEVATALEAYQRARDANAGRRLGEFMASTGEADRWLREEVQRMADALGARTAIDVGPMGASPRGRRGARWRPRGRLRGRPPPGRRWSRGPASLPWSACRSCRARRW
jgi:hypothetical protein